MTVREEICRDGKRYRTLSRHLRETTGRRIVKIPLSSGCACPNRDGTKGVGGCAFCTAKGGGEFAPEAGTLLEEYEQGRQSLLQKWPDADCVAYFQAFTNTCCAPEALRGLLDRTRALPGVRGVRLATRGDCLPPEIVSVLREAADLLPLTVELGLQTANDEAARRMNRCHTTAEFIEGFLRLREAGIPACVHLIDGLPGETMEDMLASARLLGKLRPAGVKLHMLHILEGSALGDEYQREPFPLLTREEYVDVVCRQLELLAPETVIERLTGDGDRRTLLAPDWTKHKRAVLNAIDGELARRDTWQARKWGGNLMVGILQLAKDRLAQTANESGVYVDFTMGKGKDTAFLCSLCPKGHVYAFDVQPAALEQTTAHLAELGLANAELILDSHDNFRRHVKEPIDGGLFNLGFLPGGDRSLTTRCETTLRAVKGAMEALKPGGALGVAVYPGHAEGEREGSELQAYFATVDKKEYDVFIYRLLNVPDSPYMMIVERR